MIALFIAAAWATTVADVQGCLAANDVACAERGVADLGASQSADPSLLALAAETAFYGGHYDAAKALGHKASDAGWADGHDQLGLYDRTADVMQDWAEVRTDRFIIRYRPGVDAILVDDALEALRDVEKNVTPLLGGPPPGPTILELYPNGRSFVDASSLPKEAVETTGVVALSKWSRLLAMSPRALGRGYAWKDTITHEYIHLVVAHQTDDRAPVWLQEAIARYLDNRWPDGKDHFKLSPRDAGLLGKALRDDKLITFEQMYPSLALLPSAEMAALGYAQVSSLMSYCFLVRGDDVLTRALPAIKAGTDARVALAAAVGTKDFPALEAEWRQWLEEQHLDPHTVAELPTKLDGADAVASDPVMSNRADLARYMRLGDLMRDAGHPDAALVEYAKAIDPLEPPSPLLANSIAQAHLALGDLTAARKDLEESLKVYPEFALSHKTLGAILVKQGQSKAATQAYREAANLNPFDPEVQQALVALYKAQGDTASAARREGYLKVLQRGGPEPADIHLIRDTEKP